MTGRLVICATPIGNLNDATVRLRSELTAADLIYAEDTRRAATLLQALGVETKARSYFVGNEEQRSAELADRLLQGLTVALISDAGMPAIADPGLSAVRAAVEVGSQITVVPGPSAITTALAVSGLPAERFVFEGFLPRKGQDRAQRLAEIREEQRTTVLFSARSRVAKDIVDLGANLSADRPLVVARELTKAFEEIWRGTIGEAAEYWSSREPRGEFTLVIGGASPVVPDLEGAVQAALAEIDAGTSMADAVKSIAVDWGVRRRELYEAVLRTKK